MTGPLGGRVTGDATDVIGAATAPVDAPELTGAAELAREWRAAIEDYLPEAVALRHDLHARPELSGHEDWTAARVAGAIGLPAERVAETGRLIRVGPADRPAVALRAELDALPLRERTGAPFAATGEAMHACGHDVHLAALAAVVRAAAGLDLPIRLLAVLQPREETVPMGALDVVESGALQAHDVRAVIGAHVQPRLPAGLVAADPGPVNAGMDEFEITVTGRGGHTGYPHLAADPVSTLCRCVLGLQDALRGSVDPIRPATLTVTQLSAGAAANVIPVTAVARGSLRTMFDEDAAGLHGAITDLVAGIAAAYGCTGRVEITEAEPALVNDAQLAAAARAWFPELGLAPGPSFSSCGADDFAFYATAAPILMLFVGAAEQDDPPMLHEAEFLPADHLVGVVARAMLAGVLAAAGQLTLLRGRR